MKINFPVQQMKFDMQNTMGNTEQNNNISFANFLNSAISEVNNLQIESEKLSEAFAIGKTDNIQQVMIASEKADMALQFTLQVRNKILDAYNDIMRMPV